MLTGGTLTPAYGRDYSKRADVVDALNAGVDFTMHNHTFHGYCSIRDLADGMFTVRNKNYRTAWTVTIKSGRAK